MTGKNPLATPLTTPTIRGGNNGTPSRAKKQDFVFFTDRTIGQIGLVWGQIFLFCVMGCVLYSVVYCVVFVFVATYRSSYSPSTPGNIRPGQECSITQGIRAGGCQPCLMCA